MHKFLVLFGLVLFASLISGAIFGSARYGGLDGLLRRAQAEFIPAPAPQHPLQVPTPLPTATPSRPVAATTIVTAITPSPTATPPAPTATSLATTTATTTPTPGHVPVAQEINLDGIQHAWQTWNNCGPATLAMHLSYYGGSLDQEAVRRELRPNRDDKNVRPDELADFARFQGLSALVRVNGSAERLKLLLSNGIPVLIETWLVPEPNDGMGHYRLLTGFYEAEETWIAYDSYVSTGLEKGQKYAGIRIPYAEIEKMWPVFNATYVLLYTPDQEELIASILGEDLDDQQMWLNSVADAQSALQAQPDNAFHWFNLGTSMTALERWQEAAAAYDQARTLGLPWRMLWYQFGPFQAYYETGRYEEVLALVDATLRTTTEVEELYYWRGKALEALGDLQGARRAYERALNLNPNDMLAEAALSQLGTSS